MNQSTRRAAALASLAALCLGMGTATKASAQNALTPRPPKPHASAIDPSTFSIEFAGGTLAAYVDAIRAAAGNIPVNISISEDIRSYRVPSISLQNVSAFLALQVLRQTGNESKRLDVITVSDAFGDLYLVKPVPEANKPALANPPRADDGRNTRLVISLEPLLASTPEGKRDAQLSTILSAVEAALKLGRSDEDPMPDIALHKESHLLMVLANHEDQVTVQSIVQQMMEGSTPSGEQWTTRTYDLLSIDANAAARAILGVFPETNARMGKQQRLDIKSPKQIEVSGPQDRVLQIEGIINYVDQPQKESAEVVQLRTRLEMREREFAEQGDSNRRREVEAEARADKAGAQLSETTRQVVALQAQINARDEDRNRMQARLDAAEATITQLRSGKTPEPPKK